MSNFKIENIQLGNVIIDKEYSLSGNQVSYKHSDSDVNINVKALSNIRKLSNLSEIKTINEYYKEMFTHLNLNILICYKEVLGRKKSKEYLTYLKDNISETSKIMTNYHTDLFKLRKNCYTNLSKVELNGSVLETPIYNHTGVTGRTSITQGFNFLTLKKEKRKNIKPIDKTNCLIEVDFKSCEPFFYLKSKNIDVDCDDIYLWLCNKYQIKITNRDYVKRGILSMIYGANEKTISRIMKIPPSKVIKIKEDLGILELKTHLQSEYDKHGYFFNYYGRPITSDNNLVNYYIQSSAVDYCSFAFVNFCKIYNVSPSYFIHDSMTFQCKKERLESILKIKSITDPLSNIDIPIEFNVLHE